MADHQPNTNNGSNGWFKMPTFIIGGLIAGLIAWGAVQAQVAQHEKAIERLETARQVNIQQDTLVAERLARIEANLQFVVEELRRQQQSSRR